MKTETDQVIYPKKPIVRTFHNDAFKDDYEYLREFPESEIKELLEKENQNCEKKFKRLESLTNRLYDESIARMVENNVSLPTRNGVYWYFTKTRKGHNYSKTYRIHAKDFGGVENWIPLKMKKTELLKKSELIFDKQFLADESKRETGSQFFAASIMSISEDDQFLLWGCDTSGAERYTLKITDLKTGKSLKDEIENTQGGMFDLSGEFVFYIRADDAWRCNQIWRHKLGDSVKNDVLVYEEKDELFNVGISMTADKEFLVISSGSNETDEVQILDAKNPLGKFEMLWQRKSGVEMSFTTAKYGSKRYFFIIHNQEQLNYQIDLYDENMQKLGVLIAGDDEMMVKSVSTYKHYLVFSVLKDIVNRKFFITADDFVQFLKTNKPEKSSILESSKEMTSLEQELTTISVGSSDFESPVLMYSSTSYIQPLTLYAKDLREKDSKPKYLRRQIVKNSIEGERFSSKNYSQKMIFANAEDGSKVPITLLWRKTPPSKTLQKSKLASKSTALAKNTNQLQHLFGTQTATVTNTKSSTKFADLPKNRPLILNGYGSYGSSQFPGFSVGSLDLLDRGIVVAYAHTRGGMEKGKKWYLDGKKLNKKNTFSDFICAAHFLEDLKITSREKMAAIGGSAGGLLMGAVLNLLMQEQISFKTVQKPLFKAIHAAVPFVDALTTILKPELPLTIPEWEEWGNPLEDREVYQYMKSYSPYENIVDARSLDVLQIPKIFVTSSFNDTRVLWVEPVKWVAKLREMGYSPILKMELEAGHSGKTGRYNALKESAFETAFIVDAIIH